ncbi:hypothetical protein AJ80_07870 [Polytolypa hystricis UAMH7299]|uniref:Uncharacterized protein n=1 Tax=Polytolypa hystricis (strain UAMH7299) TaxID=1447883 RepID=A0A2B7XI72_POLH7|nr:hypothetical protein AJ80_07870 [Polytolypa hystricis UAMH7299]
MNSNAPENGQPPKPPRTPPQPPYSPVTPVLSHSSLFPLPSPDQIILPPVIPSLSAAVEPRNATATSAAAVPIAPPQPLFTPEPAPIPISESENPDAIALRAALSILQVQKQRALSDIQTLEKLKSSAAQHPEAFAKELVKGNLRSREGDLFNPVADEEEEEEEEEEEVKKENGIAEQKPATEGRNGDGGGGGGGEEAMDIDPQPQPQPLKQPKFPKVPAPQNIVRMPPINWAKYHVIGEPLDKLHDEQRVRPWSGEPRRDSAGMAAALGTGGGGALQHQQQQQPQAVRAPEHFIAAPYRPFVDRLETGQGRTRSGGSKGKK